MIGRLKRRFVGMTMLIFTLVLAVIIIGIYAYMRMEGARSSQRILEQAVRRDGQRQELSPPPGFSGGLSRPGLDGDASFPPPDQFPRAGFFDQEAQLLNVFSVKVDSAGEIQEILSGFDSEDSDIEALLSLAQSGGQAQGTLEYNGASFRYLYAEKPYGGIYAFLSQSWEQSILARTLAVSLLVGGGCLVTVFCMSLFLAGWSVRPIARAWAKQKEFVANASHELKTPLTTILANTDVMLANPESTVASQGKWLDYIRAEAQRMSGLVADLLFLAKADDGSEAQERKSFCLSDAVERAVLPMESLIFEQGKALRTEITPDITMVGDEARVVQLVVLLMDNAIKHSDPNGDLTLTLAQDRDRARLTVTNTGPAIPPESLDKIFERFYRVDASRNRQTGGYGLGLSIVRQIVDMHRGKIEVSSGEITTFTVTLPLGDLGRRTSPPSRNP